MKRGTVTLMLTVLAGALLSTQLAGTAAFAASKKTVCSGMWGGLNASTMTWDGHRVVAYTFTGRSYPTGHTRQDGAVISFGTNYKIVLSGVPMPGATLTATYDGPAGHGEGQFSCN